MKEYNWLYNYNLVFYPLGWCVVVKNFNYAISESRAKRFWPWREPVLIYKGHVLNKPLFGIYTLLLCIHLVYIYIYIYLCISVYLCIIRLTQHPLHDQHLCPRELCGFDPENLSRVVCDGLVGQVLHTLKAVWSIDDQQAEEEGEGDGVSHKLHEGTAKDLTELEAKITGFSLFSCVWICGWLNKMS